MALYHPKLVDRLFTNYKFNDCTDSFELQKLRGKLITDKSTGIGVGIFNFGLYTFA